MQRIGGALSLLCAAHCALTPVVVALVPALHLTGATGERVEHGLIWVSLLLVGGGVLSGLRDGRGTRPGALFVGALAALALAEVPAEGPLHVTLRIAGGLLLAATALARRHSGAHSCEHHHAPAPALD